jgi:hypothetical protein
MLVSYTSCRCSCARHLSAASWRLRQLLFERLSWRGVLSTQLHADSSLGDTDATTLQVVFAIPLPLGGWLLEAPPQKKAGWLAFTAWMRFVCSRLTGASLSSLRTAAADADHSMLSCIISRTSLAVHTSPAQPAAMLCHCDCCTLTLRHAWSQLRQVTEPRAYS